MAVACVAALVLAVVLALVRSLTSTMAPASDVASAAVGRNSQDHDGPRRIAPAEGERLAPSSSPIRVRIPSIGVDSPLLRLDVDDRGALEPPDDFDRAGWFERGPAPGDVGPAVIAGHVDSSAGPAVFFRLGDLVAGDDILIDRADGTTARFAVVGDDRFPKDEFPTEQVYGPTARAELRLITCGGEFDRLQRSYRDNVVVAAVLS